MAFNVDVEGSITDSITNRRAHAFDVAGISSYHCANCGRTFDPDGLDNHDVDHAWQEALDHLPKSDNNTSVRTSDGRLVRVEVA